MVLLSKPQTDKEVNKILRPKSASQEKRYYSISKKTNMADIFHDEKSENSNNKAKCEENTEQANIVQVQQEEMEEVETEDFSLTRCLITRSTRADTRDMPKHKRHYIVWDGMIKRQKTYMWTDKPLATKQDIVVLPVQKTFQTPSTKTSMDNSRIPLQSFT